MLWRRSLFGEKITDRPTGDFSSLLDRGLLITDFQALEPRQLHSWQTLCQNEKHPSKLKRFFEVIIDFFKG